MSHIVTHSNGSKNKKSSNGPIVIIVSLLSVVALLFGLNYFFSKQNKNNTESVTKVIDNRYTIGDQNAKIKLVEYADFQCPACAVFSSVFPEVFNYINEKYGSTTLSLTYKYFPLITIHKNALLSAYSVEAAKEQGKFWEMHDILFEKQSEWSEALDAKAKIEEYAKELGLDISKFITDRDSDIVKDTVNRALIEATRLELDHTPTIFMNGEEIKNMSLSAKDIEKIIEDKLNGSSFSSSVPTTLLND